MHREFGIIKGMVEDIQLDAHHALCRFDPDACDRLIVRMRQIKHQADAIVRTAREAKEAGLLARARQYVATEPPPKKKR